MFTVYGNGHDLLLASVWNAQDWRFLCEMYLLLVVEAKEKPQSHILDIKPPVMTHYGVSLVDANANPLRQRVGFVDGI